MLVFFFFFFFFSYSTDLFLFFPANLPIYFYFYCFKHSSLQTLGSAAWSKFANRILNFKHLIGDSGAEQGGEGIEGAGWHGVVVEVSGHLQPCEPNPFTRSSKKKLSEKQDALYVRGHTEGPGQAGQTDEMDDTFKKPIPVALRNPATLIITASPTLTLNTILERSPQKSSLQATIWLPILRAVSVVSNVVPVEQVSIETVPVPTGTYRKNTSAPSSKQDVTFEVVAHRVEKKVTPSNKGRAEPILSLLGGMQTGMVVSTAELVGGTNVGNV